MTGKQDGRKRTQKEQDAIRETGVRMVVSGISQSETARILGVSRQSVNGWYSKYKENGKEGLACGKRGNPQEPKLKGHQAATIVNIITDRHPEQLKLPFVLWTREAVRNLIKNKFNLELSIRTVGRYLQNWGFTSQKPFKKAMEQNPIAVKEWLEKEYPAIKEKAKNQKAMIFWGDETGIKSTHATGKGYSPKGKTPELKISGKRFSTNVISVVNNSGKMYFKAYTSKFSSKVFIEFLGRLIKQHKGKIYLIIDRHSVHTSGKVQEWLKKRKRFIEVFYLPPYSPELNPTELLNQDLKSNLYKPGRPADVNQLKAMINSSLKSYQTKSQKIQNLFKAEKVQYAA
jgi:transposase